jgi:hypothetical protein
MKQRNLVFVMLRLKMVEIAGNNSDANCTT